MTVTYTVGDTREVIKGIADGSVDFICSSPPFLALRSYVPADHESKGDEIGSERNPAEFIDMLLGLTAEWGRVLAPHGSIAIELGDTYAGTYSPIAASPMTGPRPMPGSDRSGAYWPRAKSLALIPQLYAVALAYGINPLTGQPSPAGRWLVRNVIVWHRPNPAVGALGDKVRPSTSYIVVATRSAKRWFDLTAVRSQVSDNSHGGGTWTTQGGLNGSAGEIGKTLANPAGAPPLDAWFDEYDTAQIVEGEEMTRHTRSQDVAFPSTLSPFDPYDGTHDTWTLTTQPSRLAHYAMWPAKLAERLILMMCPREVCRVCSEPRRRIEGKAELARHNAVAAHIRYQREQTGMTAKEVAAHFPSESGGTTGCVWNWENGASIPTAQQWPVLKALLNLCDNYDDIIASKAADFAEYTDPTGRIVDVVSRDATKNIANGFGGHSGKRDGATTRRGKTLGWTDCGCDVFDDLVDGGVPKYRPGLVLDPFAGSGTTLAVADLHGRDAIGIDFDARNKAIYPARYDEVKRALYGTPAPMPGQGDLFAEEAG